MNNIKTPFVRIAKKTEIFGWKLGLLTVCSFFLALVAGGLFVLALGQNPFSVYASIVSGAFRSGIAISGTVKLIVPLLITSLGIVFAFKMKFWNIGAEGQIIMGGIFASFFALFCSNLPHVLLIAVMLIAGMIGGGIWALIPAYFKTKFGTNETLFTLMLNYIALYFIRYFAEGPWRDPSSSGYPKIASFAESARLSKVFGVHSGWIIAILLVVIVYIYMKYTKQGYEISVVGESERTAQYAGMNVGKIVLRTMFLSGAVCGIAGMVQVSGAAYTLSEGVANGVGFTAIIVAWLARLNPIICVVVSAIFAIIQKGSSVMQSTFGLSPAVSDVLQGIILFFVLGGEFFARYKLVFKNGGEK